MYFHVAKDLFELKGACSLIDSFTQLLFFQSSRDRVIVKIFNHKREDDLSLGLFCSSYYTNV